MSGEPLQDQGPGLGGPRRRHAVPPAERGNTVEQLHTRLHRSGLRRVGEKPAPAIRGIIVRKLVHERAHVTQGPVEVEHDRATRLQLRLRCSHECDHMSRRGHFCVARRAPHRRFCPPNRAVTACLIRPDPARRSSTRRRRGTGAWAGTADAAHPRSRTWRTPRSLAHRVTGVAQFGVPGQRSTAGG